MTTPRAEPIFAGMQATQPSLAEVAALVGNPARANVLMAHADGVTGREALKRLDFYAHTDLFMNPTAAMADIVLPAASAFEREGLKVGFEISAEAQSLRA